MTPIVAGITGATQIIGSVFGANASKKAASTQASAAEAGQEAQVRAAEIAQETQLEMFREGQETQHQMFERTQEILRPYVQAGEAQLATLGGYTTAGPQAFERQLDLAGLRGPQAQQAAIEQVRTQPRFGALTQAGEEAILANASATGGLRGGNTQNALARFRSDLLADEIEREYARFGGLTAFGQGVSQNVAQMGQASAANTGTAALQTGQSIASLQGAAGQGIASLQSATGQGIAALQGAAGAARAGGTLGSAAAYGNLLNIPAQVIGLEYGLRRAGQRGLLF